MHLSSYTKMEYLYSLDILRGLAALTVVLWHWSFFFSLGGVDVKKEELPLYDYLSILYEVGHFSVDLFFCLSGFIFCWLYAEKISQQNIKLYDFFILRFSRLYPIYIVSILIIFINQWFIFDDVGVYLITQHNDLYHLFLNIFFMSSWGLEKGLSFNVPAWSVSVEVFLYCIFFISCKFIVNSKIRSLVWVALSILGFFLVSKYYMPFSRGLGAFFEGSICYLVFSKINNNKITTIIISLVTVIALILTVILSDSWNPEYSLLIKFKSNFIIKILLPAVVLSIALLEVSFLHNKKMKSLSWLGDISYSSYLLHFPLIAVAINMTNVLGISNRVFLLPWVMVFFFFILILVSLVSFKYFERPCQKYLRSKLIR